MTTSLVKIGQSDLQQGGQGINLENPLFKLKPSTLSINQRMTEKEGAIPGKFMIDGDPDFQFDEMTVVMLDEPKPERAYQPGTFEQRKAAGAAATMCFSRDCVTPDPRAKVPQAMTCKGCPRADWTPYQKWRDEHGGVPNNELIPPCGIQYPLYLIDTKYKMPLRMFVRGGSITGFQDGCEAIAKKLLLLQSAGFNPNIFDLSFRIKVVKGKKGTNYVLWIDPKSIKMISDEEKNTFGNIYLNFINSRRKSSEEIAQEEATSQIEQASGEIDNVLTGDYVDGNGDITI